MYGTYVIITCVTILISLLTYVAASYNGNTESKALNCANTESKALNCASVSTINSTLNIQRGNEEIPQVAELSQNLKSMIDSIASKIFEKQICESFIIGFSNEKFGLETKDHFRPELWLPLSHYQAAVKYILSQGLEYDGFYNRHIGKGKWKVEVSLPIKNGKVYSSAMELWEATNRVAICGLGKESYFNPKPLVKRINGEIRPQTVS